jgi:Ca2+-binding RTX toxin-like protein
VATWGGNSSAVGSLLDGSIDVTQIWSNGDAFAALRADGSVVTWGSASYGGDSRTVANQLDGTVDVTQIYSADGAFAALRADGSVVTWGVASASSSAVASQLHDVVSMANPYTHDVYIATNVIQGTVGNDTLIGGSGNDTLNGGTGADSMLGGTGNDTYLVDNSGDVVTELSGQGKDLVKSSVTFNLATKGANVEQLTLTGTKVINGTGNGLNNVLTGNFAANSLIGNNGNDTLVGNAGVDKLSGGNGADLLQGGAGNDTLTGGAGNDLFRFDTAPNSSSNVDKITDFNGKVGTTDTIFDRIHLEITIFKAFAYTGALHASEFRENTTGNAQDADDHIIYNTSTGQLYYDANGNAAGGKYLVANLWDSTTTHPTGAEISAMDFVVV